MHNVGINLMCLNNELYEDLWGTAAKLKEAGYDFCEIPSDFGADPKTLAFYREMAGGRSSGWSETELRERVPRLREMGIPMRSLFIFTEHILEEAESMGKFCEEFGIETLIISILDINKSTEKCYEYIALINELTKKLEPYPVTVCLHNHEIDFEQIETEKFGMKPIFEVLLDECPQVKVELDNGWMTFAGADAEGFFEKYGDRIQYLHIKDLHRDYRRMDRDNCFVAAGDGCVDTPKYVELAEKYCESVPDMIMDQDRSLMKDIMEDTLRSVRYLKALK